MPVLIAGENLAISTRWQRNNPLQIRKGRESAIQNSSVSFVFHHVLLIRPVFDVLETFGVRVEFCDVVVLVVATGPQTEATEPKVGKPPSQAACWVCRRTFRNVDALIRHERDSKLHENNLQRTRGVGLVAAEDCTSSLNEDLREK